MNKLTIAAAALALMTSAAYAGDPRFNFVQKCAAEYSYIDTAFTDCLEAHGASHDAATATAAYLAEHRRALDRVQDKLSGEHYLIYAQFELANAASRPSLLN